MIVYLRGTVLEKNEGAAVIEAGGIGYEVHLTPTALLRLGGPGEPVEVFVSESTPMYGGGTSLYGFLSRDERQIFFCLREHVPSTGAKKALEYLEKASRSLPDFRRAVLETDVRMLSDVFGFTKKTAERLVGALKDKLGGAGARGGAASRGEPAADGTMGRAMDALASLGYKSGEARAALQSVTAELAGRRAGVEEIIRLALKRL
ncbi:MAG: Holliday junction ATP-dependent DNA helicase RuvA [Elusimicrobia bacterium]|nr:Holliday junction ATP-dependent DNA helicase RuvA [Elusimicrobiota bacterium]